MTFDDKGWPVFPTRNGEAIGTALENKMLRVVGGAEGIRTRTRILPDGSTVRLKTRAGMPEFVRLTDSMMSCLIHMDAGIIDLRAGGDSDPDITLPAIFHATNYVSAKVAGGTKAVGAGTISSPGFVGTFPANGDTAKSFYKAGSSWDEAKKVVAWHVPPSMFTGRTKLYVQSLYGGTNPGIQITDGGGARPYIEVTTAGRESAGYPAIPIATGTGVFYDATDGTHWLINVTTNEAYIYRMSALSACVEKIRAALLSDKHTPDEKERLESYLLSQSIPEAAPSFVLSFPTTPDSALGYGWHWNYTGDCCDIVDVAEVSVRPGAYGFETTHYRLTFSRVGGVFTVSRSIVTPTSRWSVPKNQNVIAYPDWLTSRLVKAGNLPSGITDTAQSGVVYAFYKGDDLQLITFTGTVISGDSDRVSSPYYFGALGWADQPATFLNAMENGSSSGNAAWVGYTTAFALGATTIGGENSVIEKDEIRGEWIGRKIGEIISIWAVPGSGVTMYTGVGVISNVAYSGGKPTSYDYAWTESENIHGTQYIKSCAYTDTWRLTSRYYEEIKGAMTLIVIPFMDAQAVYMSDNPVTHRIGTESAGFRKQSEFVDDAVFQYGKDGNYSEFFNKYRSITLSTAQAPGGTPDVSSAINESESASSTLLVSAAGTFAATPADLSPFFSALDYVEQSWGTLSSINGVVFSESNGIAEGSTQYPAYPSIVGWA